MTTHWLNRLDETNVHLDVTDDTRWRVARRLFTQKLERPVDRGELGNLLEEYSEDKEFMAMLEAETLTETGRHVKAVDRSLEQQMVEAHLSGLHAYHPDKYGTVEEMVKNAIDGLGEDRSGQYWDFNSLLRYVLPYCMRKGISLPELIWCEESRAKLRHIAALARKEMRAAGATPKMGSESIELAPETNKRLGEMMAAVADPSVSAKDFKAKFPSLAPSGIPEVQGYEYLIDGASSVLVLPLNGAQIALVKSLLKGKLGDLQVGTGEEEILDLLINRKGKKA